METPDRLVMTINCRMTFLQQAVLEADISISKMTDAHTCCYPSNFM